ncbi:MAG: sulfurtransferase TusA family protein [Promethearchaeota archaeon]
MSDVEGKEPDYKLDVRGKVCPIPAAETRKVLRGMETGEVLEIEGDFREAAVNVEKMALKNGGEVLSKETRGDFFRLVVKKVRGN